jgi:hypothetical protein
MLRCRHGTIVRAEAVVILSGAISHAIVAALVLTKAKQGARTARRGIVFLRWRKRNENMIGGGAPLIDSRQATLISLAPGAAIAWIVSVVLAQPA